MKSFKKYSSFVAIIFGAAGVALFLFLVAIVRKGNISGNIITEYTGIDLTFGVVEHSIQLIKPCTILIIALVLIGVGIVFSLLTASKKPNKMLVLVGALGFILGGVALFLTNSWIALAEVPLTTLNLGIGAILGGVLSVLAGLIALVKLS